LELKEILEDEEIHRYYFPDGETDASEKSEARKRAVDTRIVNDIERITHDCERFGPYAELMGIALPKIERAAGKLWVHARPFNRLLNGPPRNDRRRLAELAVRARIPDPSDPAGETIPLIPPDVPTFWGIGSTTYPTFVELMRLTGGPRNVVSTANFEIAKRLYFESSENFHKQNVKLNLLGCRIDWDEGSLKLFSKDEIEDEIAVAVISFDRMAESGELFSKSEVNQTVTNGQLPKVRNRIVILADSTKFRKWYDNPGKAFKQILIPENKEVFLATDCVIPDHFTLPAHFHHVILTDDLPHSVGIQS
jgi:hypothetical protein